MAPNSPTAPRSPATPAQPTLAPNPILASGSISRAALATPRRYVTPLLTPHAGPSNKKADGLSSAEAYANANRRDKGSKPLFDWITRKLGAGRRATVSEVSPARVNANGGLRPPANGTHASSRAKNGSTLPNPPGARRPLDPTQIFQNANLTRENSSIARSESHSLHSYSYSYANSTERDRRREANNPYPSIPVPLQMQQRAGSTLDSESMAFSASYITRSRTPSIRSEDSRPRRFSTMYDGDGDSSRGYRGARWLDADEDASVRPLPPSLGTSPAPSTSILSQSASTSMLSPQATSTSFRPPSPPFDPRDLHRPSLSSSAGRNVSFTSSDVDDNDLGEQSRRDSASTKPTTIVSFDSAPHVAHIAQVPSPNVPSPQHAMNVILTPPIPGPSTPTSASPSDSSPATPLLGSPHVSLPSRIPTMQAPKHSAPHPRDNPHPSSPPEPNASTLTLASSTFAILPNGANSGSYTHPPSIHRLRETRPTSLTTSPSVTFAADAAGLSPDRPASYNEYPPSVHALSMQGTTASQRTGGWGYGGRADRDASVRAIRRKGSWESNESGWSWRAAGQGHGLGQTPSRASQYYSTDDGETPGPSPLSAVGETDPGGAQQSPLTRGLPGSEQSEVVDTEENQVKIPFVGSSFQVPSTVIAAQ
ncbi:hypothetical protein BCR39DRAFT_519293 [Naematelia encephala]|uniref:Proteophosphoglycan ppg4 n=1 Tax=Naematelia encephala TaxID=71784 RepID=A0A1Y2BG71_9TREE|nr:hypothetical protein BCR39DRAFT_519293 [Naematelia encephala]